MKKRVKQGWRVFPNSDTSTMQFLCAIDFPQNEITKNKVKKKVPDTGPALRCGLGWYQNPIDHVNDAIGGMDIQETRYKS